MEVTCAGGAGSLKDGQSLLVMGKKKRFFSRGFKKKTFKMLVFIFLIFFLKMLFFPYKDLLDVSYDLFLQKNVIFFQKMGTKGYINVVALVQ